MMQKNSKINTSKTGVSELGIKHWFVYPHHPQSTSILEKFHPYLKASVRKHIHSKLTLGDTLQLHSLVLGCSLALTVKRAYSSCFLVDPCLSENYFHPQLYTKELKKVLLDNESMGYTLALTKENISINKQKIYSEQKVIWSSDKFKVSDLVYIKNIPPSTWDSNGNLAFEL